MTDHLKEHTGATAVYIGKKVSPKKPIKDDDDDMAHLDTESEKIVRFSHSTEG